MNCEDVQNLLSAYIDGELSDDELPRVHRHVTTCAECSRSVMGLRDLSLLVEGTLKAVEPSIELEERVLTEIGLLRQGAQIRRVSRAYIATAIAGAVMFLGVLLSPLGLLVRSAFRLSFALFDGVLDLVGLVGQGWMTVLVIFFIILSGTSLLGVLRLLQTRYSEVLE